MKIRFLALAIILSAAAPAAASELLLMNFELVSGANSLYRGNVFIKEKKTTWSRGLKRSYLRLRCQKKDTGVVEKTYSTEDIFDGLSISHQRVDDEVRLTITHSKVKPRLAEIRALAKNECREMFPVVTRSTQSYSFPVDGSGETLQFSEGTIFKYTLQEVDKAR